MRSEGDSTLRTYVTSVAETWQEFQYHWSYVSFGETNISLRVARCWANNRLTYLDRSLYPTFGMVSMIEDPSS